MRKYSFLRIVILYSMILVLKNNENLEKSVKIKTVHGDGMLYITNTSIVIIIDKRGILFERLHTQITSIISTNKNRIKIMWYENSDHFDFTFKINNAQNIVNDILRQHSYDDIFSDIQTKI